MYNPQMILFKREIMSDIPFAALLILNVILYQKLKPADLKQLIFLSLLTGLMLTVRPGGVVFVAAVAIEQFVNFTKRKINFKDFIIRTGLFIFIPVAIYFTVNSLLFKVPSGGSLTDYFIIFNSGNLLTAIPENFAVLIEVFRYLYVPEAGLLKGFSLLFGSVMVVATLLGFIKRFHEGPEAIEWLFILHIMMVLALPTHHAVFRLMIPIGFITLFYAATGLKAIQFLSGIPAWKKATAICILILVLYMPGIYSIARSQSNILDGPQRESSKDVFNYIRNNVPAEAVVVFAKPRALALYAGCHSMGDPLATDQTILHLQVVEANATYILIHNTLTSGNMQRYAGAMKSRLTRQWENKEFVLYKINPVNP